MEVEPAIFWTTLVRGEDPVDAQRPTVLAENCQEVDELLSRAPWWCTLLTFISYAKLYQVFAVKDVLHFSTPPTIQTRLLGFEPTPNFSYKARISAPTRVEELRSIPR